MEESTARAVLREIAPLADLISYETLAGGVSAQTFRLEYLEAGVLSSVVVSVHSDVDWRRNPNLALDEFAVLNFLKAKGYPVPAPVAVRTETSVFDRPYLVVEHLAGHVVLGEGLIPHLGEMARVLAQLHTLSLNDWPLAEYPPPRQQIRPSETLDDRMMEGQVRAALSGYTPRLGNTHCLLHGDYWAGNLLWRDSMLVAVIDWEDFGVGEPLADLGNARVELALQAGVAAIEPFTHAYLKANPIDSTDLPYWDLVATLFFAHRISEFAADQHHEATLYERINAIIEQALV